MIVIQAGHLNIGSNCNWGIRDDTGHEGEVAAVVAVCQATAAALGARHVPVMVTDANFNCLDAAGRDYQAVLSVHAGAPPAVGVGHPEADGAAPESAQLAAAISRIYAERTGVAPNGNAQGAIDHYLFQVLSSSTPWALVELGDVTWVSDHLDLVVSVLAAGLLDFLGMPEAEPVPEWKTNLQPHVATIVLNRPVRQVDLGSGIAGGPSAGVLEVAFTTQVGSVGYYVPQATALGAEPAIGWLRSEVDAASSVSVPAAAAAPAPPIPAPAAAPVPPAPAPAVEPLTAPQAAATAAEASASAAPSPGPAERFVALLRELHGVIPDVIAHLEKP